MSAACTVRMMAGRVGAARSATRRHRSIYAASRWFVDRRLSHAPEHTLRPPAKESAAAAGVQRHPRMYTSSHYAAIVMSPPW
jgi:hypothetical protein